MLRRTELKRSGPIKAKAPKGRRNAILKRGSTAAKAYLGRVAELGCAVCRLLGYGPTPAQVHHQKEGAGMGCRADDWKTIPLCFEHHLGPTGIHHLKSHGFVEAYGISERELVEQTQRELGYDPTE